MQPSDSISHLVHQFKIHMSFVASVDQSTTSTKCCIYSPKGHLLAKHLLEHTQITPKEGWLEHDPIEIINNVRKCITGAVQQAKEVSPDFQVSALLGVGVTNQRETVVCWDKQGKPLHNAVVWCDTRCKAVCDKFTAKHGEKYRARTGLPVSTYFTLFKILWLIENVPGVRKGVQAGEVRFGTIDTWVVYNLTGEYITDASNASRTHLCDLKTGDWDEELLQVAGLTRDMLPKIVDSFCPVATINEGALQGRQVCCILGDQQSSAYAHELQLNEAKITYGTGCFLLANIGAVPAIHPSFVTTVLYRHEGLLRYGYECSVECGGGTLNWARRTGFFTQYSELNNVQDVSEQALYFFPSFGDIYSPFWKTGVQGGLVGLSLATTKGQIVAAILQSILFRVKDNLKEDSFAAVERIYADGGMTVNAALMQTQADLLGKTLVIRERDTCWGVAKGVLTALGKEGQGFQDQKVAVYAPRTDERAKLQGKYQLWCQERTKFYGWQ